MPLKPAVTKDSLGEYLKSQGVDSTTSQSEISAHKKAWYKEYHQTYYQERKHREHRMTMRLKPEEYRWIKKQMQTHDQKSINRFMLDCTQAYLEKGYVNPNRKAVEELNKRVYKIGNTINQVVHSIHRSERQADLTGAFSQSEILQKLEDKYTDLVNRVGELGEEMIQFFDNPPADVKTILRSYVQNTPGGIKKLRRLIDQLEAGESK